MKVLVTGGCGYLGSVLVQQLLRKEHDVRVLDNLMHGPGSAWANLGQDGFSLVKADIRDGRVVREAVAGADAIVHLAAIVGDPACAKDPRLTRSVNLDATFQLMEEARRAKAARFVFASTCSNYGKLPEQSPPATEETALRPVSLYAETKVEIEQALLGPEFTDLNPEVLRFSTLYGLSPRMRFDLTVNEFVRTLQCRQKLVVYGQQFWRPYVHVRDAARAILLALETPGASFRHRVFNVGDTRENYRKLDLLDVIRPRVDGGEVEFVHRVEDPRDYKVSCDRIRDELNFTITRRVADGVDEIAAAVRDGLVEPERPYSNTEGPVFAATR